jgi:hypothetical protein
VDERRIPPKSCPALILNVIGSGASGRNQQTR